MKEKLRKFYESRAGVLIIYVILISVIFFPVVFGDKSLYPLSFGRPADSRTDESVNAWMMGGGTYWDSGASDWIEIPMISEMHKSLKTGQSLLWNPYNALGLPVIGNSSAGTVAPFNLIPILFDSEAAWNFMYLARILFMMYCSYLFLRELGMRQSVAITGGCVFAFCGYAMYFMNIFHFNVDVFMPLLMWLTLKYDKKRTLLIWFSVAVCTALMLLGGNPQNIITCCLLSACFYIFLVLSRKECWRAKLLKLVQYFGAYLFAVCLTMFFWLPFIELFLNGYNYHGSDFGLSSLDVKNLMGLFFPYMALDNSLFLMLPYVGATVIIVLLTQLKLNHKNKKFFFVFALLYLLKIIGFPIIQWIGSLPILNLITYWKYDSCLYFAVMVVFCYALEDMFEYKSRVRLAVMTAFEIGLAIIYYYVIIQIDKQYADNPRLEYARVWIMVFLAALCIGVVINIWNRRGEGRIYFVCALACLELFFVPVYYHSFRINKGIAYNLESNFIGQLKQAQREEYDRIMCVGTVLMGNLSSNYYLCNISGYTAVPVGYYYEFMKELVMDNHMDINPMVPVSAQYTEKSGKYLDLLGVRHVLMDHNLEKKPDNMREVFSDGILSIYENTDSFGKAFYVYDYIGLNKKEDIFKNLADEDNLRERIVIETEQEFDLGIPKETEESVDIAEYSAGRIRIQCKSNNNGFLVVNDLYYPGWEVYVDGEKKDILKTDYILRSVFLEAGEHVVEFKYQPVSFYAGLIITVGSLMGFIIVYIIRKRAKDETIFRQEKSCCQEEQLYGWRGPE